MKNLFTIPRLSSSEALTILITLVVCLAGFTEAEIHSDYRKEDSNRQEEKKFLLKRSSFRENDLHNLKASNSRNDELKQNYFAYLKSLPKSPLDKLNEKYSVYFGESDESDGEKENDGYNYDEDEYYHFNYKRNERNNRNIENSKLDKEELDERERKGILSPNYYTKNLKGTKDQDKELKTIEMLNYKEFHPNMGGDLSQNSLQNQKQFSKDLGHKKIFSSEPLDALNVMDLKDDSAIDESLKDRKEESSQVLASVPSDSKIAEVKKGVKTTDEKDAVKLKDPKSNEDSVKKDKEVSLKDGKEAVSAKNLKESSKTSEEKEKGVKLSESSKLVENIEKVSSSNKEDDNEKITKEDKDMSRFSNKVTSDAINPKEISQINNRANFVGNEYKESLDSVKIPESHLNEKNSEEISENEKNEDLNNFPANFKEKQFSSAVTEKNDNYGLSNEHSDLAEVFQEQEKTSPYFTASLNYGFQQDKSNELYKKRESWKPGNNMQIKLPQLPTLTPDQILRHHELPLDQQAQQPQFDLSYDPLQKPNPFQNIENNFPASELENTDYYKNYLKSLRKYKNQNENTKNINPQPPLPGYNSVRKIAFRDKTENKKKKRSKPKKRRLLLSEEMSPEKEKEQINLLTLRKNNHKTQDTLSSQSEKSMVPAHHPQLSQMEAEKENTKLLEGTRHEEHLENSRLRRKSPLKLEYEIKVINQSPQEPKNVQFSRFSSKRLKKDVKTKLATGDKYWKKYPYSQVNRDDLIGSNKIIEPKNQKKYKRKAPTRERYDKKSIRTRAAPSGYYSNRVKFGQKSYTRNNEKTNSDVPLDINKIPSSYFSSGSSSDIDKNYQPNWESKQQNLNGDEDAYLREDNSLFLVKKGERTAKTFEDGTKPSLSSEELDPEQLAKILSKANDYVVFKKNDNKFRKVSDDEPSSLNLSEFDDFPLYNKKLTFAEQLPQYNMENNERPIIPDSKNLRTRSSNLSKDDKKYSETFRSSTSKSNLKKTLDKFRDLADFFKDNEQESTDNQYSAQEAKEGRDIVFSEDKLPDPIVISNDGSERMEDLSQKPQNSIYSISTNFKNLDMSGKKNDLPNNNNENKDVLTAGVKSDTTDMSWNPAINSLKTLFPEASTINSMNKNGNEIIFFDFNSNQLKTHHGFHVPPKMSKMQTFGTFNPNIPMPSTNPFNYLGDRKVQLILENNPLSTKVQDKGKSENLKSQLLGEQKKNYPLMSSGGKQPTISSSLEYNEIPSLLKNLIKKNIITFNTKTVRKKSKEEEDPQRQASESYKQLLTDLGKLSEINKSGFTREYYRDPGEDRNAVKINLPSNSISELSAFSDMNIKQLGNLLQNIMLKNYPTSTEWDNKSNRDISKNSNEYKDLDNVYQDTVKYGVDYALEHPSQWFPNEEKNEDKMESIPKEGKDEMNNIFQNQEMSKIKEKNYAPLKEQTENTFDKVHRLRREGLEKRNLENIKHAMTPKESEASDTNLQGQGFKISPDFITLDSDDLIADEEKNEKDSEFQILKNTDQSKENSEEEESLNSNYDNHLSELFENLSKNPKNPSESIWNRQKRFSRRDLEDKVSKTEVQNTILKKLPEDNYQSVSSPGIKRRLLSVKNEAENADADELDKNTAKETQENCMRKTAYNCLDPTILELFGNDGYEEEKRRGRRSLTSPFHTNFKREIDLDESMPNYFQNFLVTSLGGVGSQKPEVVKKDEASWGGKENSQDNYNQIVDSPDSKETNEDSALEKREVSSAENRKTQGYSNSNYYSSRRDSDTNFADIMGPFNRAEKKIRSESKSKIRTKSSEFADEKLPTQIRIQITNGSSKEKKSSKPIMDESETSSTDVENLPKEKEFFDKNKINPLLPNNLPKFHQVPKTKFSYSEFKEDESKDLADKKKAYHSYQRRKRKKKKYVPENPMKPAKDFITFDEKAMETLLKKYNSNQNMMSDQTTQKIPMSHPLPQVETVYNPTQGTNKAQLEPTTLGKINSINNKNAENTKNNLQFNDASNYDDDIRSYLKLGKINSDKGGLKEFEDVEWKPYTRKLGFGQIKNQFNINHPSQTFQPENPSTFSPNIDSSVLNSYTPNLNTYDQSPYSNFFYHVPSPNSMNNQFVYDILKLKQEVRNKNGINRGMSNKPYYFSDGIYKQEDNNKGQNPMDPYLNMGDKSWNYFDHKLNKKPNAQKYRMKDYYPVLAKNTNQIEERFKNPYLPTKEFSKNFSFDKLLTLNNQSPVIENYRDIDYLDTIDDDYLDEYPSKDLGIWDNGIMNGFNNPSAKDVLKKSHLSNLQKTPGYYHVYELKTPDIDDGLNEDDDELEEDYEENADEEDLDDYSFFTNPNTGDPKLTRNFLEPEKLQSYQSHPDIFAGLNYYNPQIRDIDNDVSKFISSPNDKLDLGVTDPAYKMYSDPMSSSTNFLGNANENPKIFDNSVMNNLNSFANNIAWNGMNEPLIENNINDWQMIVRDDLKKKKLRQDKLKRSHVFPQIGSRLFYAAKTEINDKDITPILNSHNVKGNKNYQTPLTNSFQAGFAGPGNDLDSESEQNENYIGENLMILENMQKDEHSEDDNEEDIKENLEGDSDAIALDNYLENVIGKYIMRKAINSSTDSSKASMESEEKRRLNNSIKHKIKKRSIQKQRFTEKEPKILKKRLSSGHLTENNYRKYHKKNFNRKRHIKNLNSSPYEVTALIRDEQNIKTKSEDVENEKQKKRSALDIFKKITNKDRENKKAENSDGRTPGFEPLLSLTDKKYDNTVRNSPLTQDRKSTGEALQTETKPSLPELKAHYPNEGQHLRAQLNEKKVEKTQETLKEYPTSSAQGPWKIDLNDNYESKAAEHSDKEPRKTFKGERIIETKLANDDDENLRAFLVISKNARRVKRNSAGDGLFTVSGLPKREIGYRPKSEEGSEKQRKRSLAAMESNAENAAKASENQILESHINTQEKIRTFHDTKRLAKGDSRPQAHNELQRNFKKNGSFVTANEKLKNSRFLSEERLPKSAFSPISDANIIRNSRNINEESSEYLGQQIVDAILYHVNTNPKFKELIAPGLTMRTTAFKNTDYNKKRALHQVEFSEQLQTFFKKFMFDLEKMTEKHVKKRMCHEIDKQSRRFLQSLLIAPTENAKEENIEIREKTFPSKRLRLEGKSYRNTPFMATAFARPETVNLNQMNKKLLKPEQPAFENLPAKHGFLLKLLNNYQNLSKVEKDTLGKNYRSLLQELDQTSHPLGIPENQSYLIPTSSFRAKNNLRNGTSNSDNLDFGEAIKLKMSEPVKKLYDQNPSTTTPSCGIDEVRENQPQSVFLDYSSGYPNTQTPENIQQQDVPVYYFTEIENPNKPTELPTTTSYNPFEIVNSVNETESKVNQETQDAGKPTQENNSTECKDRLLVAPTPQSFDLLSYQSSTTQPNALHNDEFLVKDKIEENIVKKTTDNMNSENHFIGPTDLQKLNLGDTAEVQLSLKHQSPWLNSLHVAKTLRSVSKVSKPANQPFQKSADQFLEESRNPRSLITPVNEYSVEPSFSTRNNHNNKAKYFHSRPVFPFRVDKKFFTPKVRPFENATHYKWPTKETQSCPFEYFLRKGDLPPNYKIDNKSSHGKQFREKNSFLRQYFGRKRKRRIPLFHIHHPKGGAEKRKIVQNFKNKAEFRKISKA